MLQVGRILRGFDQVLTPQNKCTNPIKHRSAHMSDDSMLKIGSSSRTKANNPSCGMCECSKLKRTIKDH